MAYNEKTGELRNPTTKELIAILENHLRFYGDTKVSFYAVEHLVTNFRVDYYADCLVLDSLEDDSDGWGMGE